MPTWHTEPAEGLSLTEVAAALRWNRSTVHKLERRALRKLWRSQVRELMRKAGRPMRGEG